MTAVLTAQDKSKTIQSYILCSISVGSTFKIVNCNLKNVFVFFVNDYNSWLIHEYESQIYPEKLLSIPEGGKSRWLT